MQNTRALARTAMETGMPLILTSSMEDNFQGLLLDDLQSIAPEAYAKRVKRPGIVDCWEYEEYKQAVEATEKKKLIMAGLTNDVCIVFPAISAVEDWLSSASRCRRWWFTNDFVRRDLAPANGK